MLDYMRKGQVEIVPSLEGNLDEFYLHHHVVKKEKRRETRWRIVFDGSSHEDRALSLNDALEMVPNLLPEILATPAIPTASIRFQVILGKHSWS